MMMMDGWIFKNSVANTQQTQSCPTMQTKWLR